jgi:hypothetical protein
MFRYKCAVLSELSIQPQAVIYSVPQSVVGFLVDATYV